VINSEGIYKMRREIKSLCRHIFMSLVAASFASHFLSVSRKVNKNFAVVSLLFVNSLISFFRIFLSCYILI
jgi:hypothetical protein